MALWVKGHQDDKLLFDLLTPKAKLNVLADELAVIMQDEHPTNISSVSCVNQVYNSEWIVLFITTLDRDSVNM